MKSPSTATITISLEAAEWLLLRLEALVGERPVNTEPEAAEIARALHDQLLDRD